MVRDKCHTEPLAPYNAQLCETATPLCLHVGRGGALRQR